MLNIEFFMSIKKISYLLLALYCIPSIADNINTTEYNTSNTIPNVDLLKNTKSITNSEDLIATEALKGLVVERNKNINNYFIDPKLTFMEFFVFKRPVISAGPYDPYSQYDEIKRISYNLSAKIDQSSYKDETISLIYNNTVFKNDYGRSGFVEFYLDYIDDDTSNMENRFNNREQNKKDSNVILKVYPKKISFQQGILFKFQHIETNKLITMPSKVTIWNEYSNSLYPCYLTSNKFLDGYKMYRIFYKCDKLPNFNDYGGYLKIIFNESEVF